MLAAYKEISKFSLYISCKVVWSTSSGGPPPPIKFDQIFGSYNGIMKGFEKISVQKELKSEIFMEVFGCSPYLCSNHFIDLAFNCSK